MKKHSQMMLNLCSWRQSVLIICHNTRWDHSETVDPLHTSEKSKKMLPRTYRYVNLKFSINERKTDFLCSVLPSDDENADTSPSLRHDSFHWDRPQHRAKVIETFGELNSAHLLDVIWIHFKVNDRCNHLTVTEMLSCTWDIWDH